MRAALVEGCIEVAFGLKALRIDFVRGENWSVVHSSRVLLRYDWNIYWSYVRCLTISYWLVTLTQDSAVEPSETIISKASIQVHYHSPCYIFLAYISSDITRSMWFTTTFANSVWSSSHRDSVPTWETSARKFLFSARHDLNSFRKVEGFTTSLNTLHAKRSLHRITRGKFSSSSQC